MGISFACFNNRENRRLLEILDRKEIARLGAERIALPYGGDSHRRKRRESRDFGALRCCNSWKIPVYTTWKF